MMSERRELLGSLVWSDGPLLYAWKSHFDICITPTIDLTQKNTFV